MLTNQPTRLEMKYKLGFWLKNNEEDPVIEIQFNDGETIGLSSPGKDPDYSLWRNLSVEIQEHIIAGEKLYKKLIENGVHEKDARMILPTKHSIEIAKREPLV